MKIKEFLRLIVAVVVSLSAGIIGSIFTSPAIPGWYAALQKPVLNPPGWVFAPVWTILYILMGISLFLIWREGVKKKEIKTAIIIFFVQLFLNASWSFVFFGMKNPGWALVNIISLWLIIITMTILFHKINKKAAYLLIPYIIWISFASYLNYAIWILN